VTPELRELYQSFVLEHSKHPRNQALPGARATHVAEGFNPLCGDRIELQLVVDDGRIVELGFRSRGCAISTAAGSTMSEAVEGKSLEEARALFEGFLAKVKGEEGPELPEELTVFSGVAAFPMRVKCATLAWHTLTAALNESGSRISTE
jgi:nitrogen fixation NifU-like protein